MSEHVIGEVLVLAGSLLAMVAAIGMFRFEDVFARMHALSKASIAAVILVLTGAAVAMNSANDITFLVLAGALQVLTSPLGANMLSVATYRAEGIPMSLQAPDDLAGDRVQAAIERAEAADELAAQRAADEAARDAAATEPPEP